MMASHLSKKVLYVGNSTVDFMNVVKEFPVEDSDTESLNFFWQRGGNATNSTTVTSLLAIPCEFFGVLATKGPEASWLRNDYREAGICTDHCIEEPVQCLVSTSIINVSSGTRSILFNLRDYRFPSFLDFDSKFGQDFSAYTWIHFEIMVRTSGDILQMMKQVATFNENCRTQELPAVVISVEIENPRTPNFESMMNLADVVFISKDFAKHQGFLCAKDAVEGLYRFCNSKTILVCAWGDEGAATHRAGVTFVAPARSDVKVVDTLGAGDTFNAGFISYAVRTGRLQGLRDQDLKSALSFACEIAGYKCSMFGYEGLRSYPLVVGD